MLKKTFIVTFALFLIQNILIWYLNPQDIDSQNIWQRNMIKAQDYIYNSSDKTVVIVGSSLAGRLVGDLLPDNVFNLSFSGSSIYDGLQIIKKTDSKPKLILVETNFIDRPIRKSFIDEIFTPIVFSLRSYFPGLRQKYQPVNLLSSTFIFKKINHALGKYINNDLHKFIEKIVPKQKKVSIANDNNNNPKNDEIVKIAIEKHQKLPNKNYQKKMLMSLYSDLDSLSNKGVKIAFFEMPMHPEICNSPRVDYLKKELRATFSPKDFLYFTDQECVGYETTDGNHLNKSSALLYTEKLVEELSKIQMAD